MLRRRGPQPSEDTRRRAGRSPAASRQRRAVERLAEANGWEMTWLADEGVSGAVPPESRKRFKAALALLEVGEAPHVRLEIRVVVTGSGSWRSDPRSSEANARSRSMTLWRPLCALSRLV
jgi:hypothetical protein